MFYRIAADALTVVHLGFMVYAVLGQLLILLGIVFRWRWIRNPWFRWTHMSAIVLVAVEAVIGISCPLTDWEQQLRALAGQGSDERSFTARIVNAILFLEGCNVAQSTLNGCYYGFAATVLATFILVPPGRKSPKGAVLVRLGCARATAPAEVTVACPREGACTHTVVCPGCAQAVGIRVRSRGHFVRKALLLALAGVAIAAAGFFLGDIEAALLGGEARRTAWHNMLTDVGLVIVLLAPSGILIRKALIDARVQAPAAATGRHRVVL